jgi:toxin ParE1/3/4
MNIRYSRVAQADIQSIFDYIAQENPKAAARVVSLIESSVMRLELFPLSGRSGAVAGTRELVVPRLPYIAVYQITLEVVEIIAVFHAAQNKPRGF